MIKKFCGCLISCFVLALVLSGCGGGGGAAGSVAARTYNGEEFAIVVLPDTQMYSHLYPNIFDAQTQWIVDNKDAYHIVYVLHEGDIVNIPGPTDGQWQNAVKSMNLLDGKVPYALAIGNHDYDDEGVTRASTKFNKYFPWTKFRDLSSFGGTFEEGKMDNTFHLFRAGGTDWLIMCLEFGPRDTVLAWANQIVNSYPNRRVIVLTHGYLYYDNAWLGSKPDHASPPSGMGIATQPGGASNGDIIWSQFVRMHKNIQYVFSGHSPGDGEGFLLSYGKNGNPVYQIMANYQYWENGGNGYMRLMLFNPKKATVTVKTYSPYLNKLYETGKNQFVLTDVAFGAP